MPLLASGSRVSIAFARCTHDDPGTIPDGFTTVQDNIAALVVSSFVSSFKHASVNFVTTYGYEKGMIMRTTGFSIADNNGYWRITSISNDSGTNNKLSCYSVPDPLAQFSAAEAASGSTKVQLAMFTLRATGRNLNLEKNILESAEIDANRYKKDVRHGFNRVVGAVGYQLSCADFMDMVRSGIGGQNWYNYTVDSDGDIDFTPGGDGTCTVTKVTTPTYSFEQDGVRPGDTVAFTSCEDSENNGQNLVLSVNGNTMVVYDPDDIKVNNDLDETAVITLAGYRIDQETFLQTFVMERSFTDIAWNQAFDGCIVDSMSFSVSPEAIIGGTMNILGMSARDWSATSIVSAVTTGKVNTSTNPPLAAFEGLILEGGSVIAVITGLEFTIANTRSLPPVVGSKFAPTITDGICVPTGTVTCYFTDATMVEKFVDETDSSLWIKLYEPGSTTRHFTIVMPKIKYTGGAIDPPAEGPVTLEMPFMALGVADQPCKIIGGPTVTTHSHCISFQDSTIPFA